MSKREHLLNSLIFSSIAMPTQRPRRIVKKYVVLWSEEVVKAVYSESVLELERLKNSKVSEAFKLIPASIVIYSLSL